MNNVYEIIKNKSNKDILIVYTALFGEYDELKDPVEDFDKCLFVCFTDNSNLKSDIWNVILVEDCEENNILKNRKYKILPHRFFSDFEYSIYIDSNILVKENPWSLLGSSLYKYDLIIPKHFSRSCIYDEARVLIRSGRVDIFRLYKQTIEYFLKGFYCQVEMGENNIIFRRHNGLVKFSECWWSEFCSGVQRDQISLSYIIWKQKILYNLDDAYSSRTGKYFEMFPHKNKIVSPIALKMLREIFFTIPYSVIFKILKYFVKMK